MYCSRCRRQLFYKDLNNHGWCPSCAKIVEIAQCKVSYWYVTAAFIALWAAQPGI
jgi:hypothetical protein